MGFFTGMLHIPAPFAVLAIAAEFLGGLGLIFGLLTRVAAFGIFCNMLVAVAMVHHQFGLFMNWTGTREEEKLRVPPAGAGDDRFPNDSRCRRSFCGSSFVREEQRGGQSVGPDRLTHTS